MTDPVPDPQRIESIFCQAIQKESIAARADFLGLCCHEDPSLRQQLESLIAIHDQAGAIGFLKDKSDSYSPLKLGQMVGPYRLVRFLGEGGFGVVYLAEQSIPMRRKVALKILKLGMDTKQIVARFEVEKQALAMMEHPGIAQVYDAGSTEQGRPYFVMEFVEGIPVTQYCNENGLSLPDRLRLFTAVCLSVQHAHQKGIIHRDLKPGNILVTQRDGQAFPKVIDFGVAKATEQRLTEQTLLTQTYHLIGTPAYLSPEQTFGSGQDVDTRSDIFSLGVLLYELLTGVTPLDSRDLALSGIEGMSDLIRHHKPVRPSLRQKQLMRSESVGSLQSIFSEQDTVSRELDWIVMKALERDRERRYSTAETFAEDVLRFLAGKTVLAVAPSKLYELRKFAGRHRKSILFAGACIALLMVFSIIAGMQASRAVRAEGLVAESRRERYVNDVKLAQVYVEGGHIGAARDRLSAYLPAATGREDLRGFAWHFLWEQLAGNYSSALVGHEGEVYCLDFSPDGNWLLSGGQDKMVRLWDLKTGKVGQQWMVPGTYDSLKFSRDGNHIGLSTREGDIRLWERQGSVYVPLRNWNKYLSARIAFSPTVDRLAIRLSDGSLEVWDLRSDSLICSRPSNDGMTVSGQGLAFTQTGDLAYRASDQEVVLLDGLGFSAKQTFVVEPSYGRGKIVISPDDRYLISTAYSVEPRIWDLLTGESIQSQNMVSIPWALPVFSAETGALLTAGRDHRIHLSDLNTLKVLRSYHGHDGQINTIASSPTDHRFASAGKDSRILIWDASSPSRTGLVSGRFRPRVNPVFYGPDEAVAVRNGHMEIAPGSVPLIHQEGVMLVDTRQNKTTVLDRPFSLIGASEGRGEFLRLSNYRTENRLREVAWRELEHWSFSGVKQGSVPLEFTGLCSSRSGVCFVRNLLALGNSLGEVNILDMNSGKSELVIDAHDLPVWELTFSTSGEQLVSIDRPLHGAAVVGDSRQVLLWDIREMASTPPARVLDHPANRPDSAVFSPADDRLAIGGGDLISIWDPKSAMQINLLDGHRLAVYSIAFSPDGKILASGAGDGVKLWDIATGRELLALQTQRTVTGIGFSPSGDVLAFISGPASLAANYLHVVRVSKIAR